MQELEIVWIQHEIKLYPICFPNTSLAVHSGSFYSKVKTKNYLGTILANLQLRYGMLLLNISFYFDIT